jgi:tRNA threonylcarbamoyladenosine biosynthesis protein TsaB
VLLLAIESAGPSCSVALAEGVPPDLALITTAECVAPQACADRLIAMAERLLEEAGRGWAALDLLAVGRGPGSFTGVRTGVAAGRGLALATGLAVLPLTSFEVLAAAAAPPAGAQLVAAIDARRGQLYVQRFDARREPLGEPSLATPEEARDAIGRGSVHIVGSGAPLLAAALAARSGVSVEPGTLDAAALARAAARRLARGAAPVPGFELQPLYLRAPDARPQQPRHVGPERAVAP